jgi:mannose-6-phosphate isomerase-like protein (cupin superfamily)
MKSPQKVIAILLKTVLFVVLPAFVLTSYTWTITKAAAQSKTTAKQADTDRTKYGKYILTEPKPDTRPPEQRREDAPPGPDMLTQMMLLDDEVIKGAFYTECSWLWKAYPDKVWVKEHAHNFDEVFGFYGTDPKNPKDLCGEVEMWIGGERHILTKSCSVFVPRGTKHCPLIIKRVDRPIFMFTVGPTSVYKQQ